MQKSPPVKIDIVNEGGENVKRLAAKIIAFTKDNSAFLKVYPLQANTFNLQHISKLKEVFEVNKKGHIGIGIISYPDVNSVEFYSNYKTFPLAKGDEVVLSFDDGNILNFTFNAQPKTAGYLKQNKTYVPDHILQYMTEHNLEFLKLTNKLTGQSMIAGFEATEYNLQYKSKKAGQQLLQSIAREILLLKVQLKK